MKLPNKRKSDKPKNGRRNRAESPADRMAVQSTYAYSSRRSEDTLNLGRQTEAITQAQISKQRSLYLIKKRIVLAVPIIILLFILYSVLHLSDTTKIMATPGSAELSAEQIDEYQAVSNKYLAGSTLNGNKITVDTDGLAKQLAERFPEIASVSTSTPLFSSNVDIYISTTVPVIALETSSGTYAVNDNGIALYKASSPQSVASNKKLIVINNQNNLKYSLNSQVLPTTYVSFIETVIYELHAKGFNYSNLTLPKAAGELDVYIAGSPYYVKFNLENNDPRQQAGTFLATINLLKSQGATPSKYVNVMIDGRAYYQ